jgi:hypothetical protein
MLFSESIVNVANLLFLLAADAVVTFITLRAGNSKANLPAGLWGDLAGGVLF